MRIPLDRQSAAPLYRQIEDYLRQQILAGRLAPETRLPATRQLAEELGVSRITVKNAYASLEGDGLIGSRAGSGTYVMPVRGAAQRGDAADWPLWQLQLPPDAARGQPAPAARHPQPIAFTGVGDPEQYPVKDFCQAIQTVIRRDGTAALEYDEFAGGYPPLRRTITHILASQGIQADPQRVLVTSGSQQGLALVCQALLRPGDTVVVEDPTYNLALELFRSCGLSVVGVPVDERGMQAEALEPLLQQRHPRLIYSIPNFQNPTGACMDGARRRQLVALADRYNVPILEDDFVGDLRYDGRSQPALKSLDPGGRVIYTGTFSKMLMPGLRVGYLLADGPVFGRLAALKRVGDLTTTTLIQRALDVYVTVGRYQAHLRRSCRLYRSRRDAMLAAVRRHLPAEVHVAPPQGGLFVWLRLPEPLSSERLRGPAAAEGVEFAAGGQFFCRPADGERFLRLNFAAQPPDLIERGIQRLGRAIWQCR